MFDLEKAIVSWRRQFRYNRVFLNTDLDELERLLKAATQKRWDLMYGSLWLLEPDGTCYAEMEDFADEWPDDAALIVALRNAAPELIAEIRALKKTVRDRSFHGNAWKQQAAAERERAEKFRAAVQDHKLHSQTKTR